MPEKLLVTGGTGNSGGWLPTGVIRRFPDRSCGSALCGLSDRRCASAAARAVQEAPAGPLAGSE